LAFKTLLTHVVDDPHCDSRLRMTASVARALGAEVIGLGALAPWPYTSATDGHGADFDRIVEGARATIAVAAERFDALLGVAGVRGTWRAEIGYPDMIAPSHARTADLIVAYPVGASVDRISYTSPDVLVMEAGLPVLLIPREEAEFQPERVLVAWKNTRESRRAISAALPFLTKAAGVTIASVCGKDEADRVRAEQADVAERLARHGVPATTLVEIDTPAAAGARLLGIARGEQAGLVVSGGYGHSRLREWVLGGVTQDLIRDGGRYVLLSH